MRLQEIARTKKLLSEQLQPLVSGDISAQIVEQFQLRRRDAIAQRTKRILAPAALALQQIYLNRYVSVPFRHNLLCWGERFGTDATLRQLLKAIEIRPVKHVLVPGCYLAGEDVQFWLRRQVKRLEGIDLHSLETRWRTILPILRENFDVQIGFQQASIESIPFGDRSFDLIASRAVLEHVRNLDAMAGETSRVLRPDGMAWHEFGPLYYCFGGDHCIAAYGEGAGYDHLLLDDNTYRLAINDQSFFDRNIDPNLPFWARMNQFSFATCQEYLAAFERSGLNVEYMVVKISEDAVRFRATHPHKWKKLTDAGLTEDDLMIKSASVLLRKSR